MSAGLLNVCVWFLILQSVLLIPLLCVISSPAWPVCSPPAASGSLLCLRRKGTTQKDSNFFSPQLLFLFFLIEFLSKKQIPWWVLFFFLFFFFFWRDLPIPSRLFHVDMMGLGCTAAPPSPCSQLRRLGSAWLPSPGGNYPRGSIWLLAGSVGSLTGRVWSSLLALSCGNLSVGSSGSLVLLCVFFLFDKLLDSELVNESSENIPWNCYPQGISFTFLQRGSFGKSLFYCNSRERGKKSWSSSW